MRRKQSGIAVAGEAQCEDQAIQPMQSKVSSESLETVTVTVGRECFQPIQFHSLEIGPISRTTAVREGETVEQAMDRATEDCRRQLSKQFDQKMQDFRERYGKIRSEVRGG
jgi:hypothetical protein